MQICRQPAEGVIVGIPPSTRLHLGTLSKQFTNWGINMQLGDILLQATTGIKLLYELGSGPAIFVPTAGDNLKLLEP